MFQFTPRFPPCPPTDAAGGAALISSSVLVVDLFGVFQRIVSPVPTVCYYAPSFFAFFSLYVVAVVDAVID
jgi:hypothetical protein